MKLTQNTFIILLICVLSASSREYILTISCERVSSCSTGYGLYASGGPFNHSFQGCIDATTCSALPQHIREYECSQCSTCCYQNLDYSNIYGCQPASAASTMCQFNWDGRASAGILIGLLLLAMGFMM